jgi:hypothetical protein
MTATSTLVFPPNRVLAQWSKHFASFRPVQVWAGYLRVHEVEALVAVTRQTPLDSLPQFLLKTLALRSEQTIEELDRRLPIGQAVVNQLLRRLMAEGLVKPTSKRGWELSTAGARILKTGTFTHAGAERRRFYFLDRERLGLEPQYLNLHVWPRALVPWPTEHPCRFSVGVLKECVGRPGDWKKEHGFPADVTEIVTAGSFASESGSPNWNRVILDRPQYLSTALVRVSGASGRDRILAFSVGIEGWVLNTAEPAFVMEAAWHELIPVLAGPPTMENWRQAWQSWCQSRQLSVADAAECHLSLQGSRLRVAAPNRLIDRLRGAPGDPFRGDEWLLTGNDLLRSAARIEFTQAGRRG